MDKHKIHNISKFVFRINIILLIITIFITKMKWGLPLGNWTTSAIGFVLTISYLCTYFTSHKKSIIAHLGLISCIIILFNIFYFVLSINVSPLDSFKGIALLFLILPEAISVLKPFFIRD